MNISNHQDRLEAQAQAWIDFLKDNNRAIDTKYIGNNIHRFFEWVELHPDRIKKENAWKVWEAHEAAESLTERQKHPQDPYAPPGRPTHMDDVAGSILGVAFAAAFKNKQGDKNLAKIALTLPAPKIQPHFIPTEIVADSEYQTMMNDIRNRAIENWHQKNPNKKWRDHVKDDAFRKYLYGVPDQSKKTLRGDARAAYTTTQERAEKYSAAETRDKAFDPDRFRDRKGNVRPDWDPVYNSYRQQKNEAIHEAKQEIVRQRRAGYRPQYNEREVEKIIEYQYAGHFAAMYPEKAQLYRKSLKDFNKSLKQLDDADKELTMLENMEKKGTAQPVTPRTPTTPLPLPPPPQPRVRQQAEPKLARELEMKLQFPRTTPAERERILKIAAAKQRAYDRSQILSRAPRVQAPIPQTAHQLAQPIQTRRGRFAFTSKLKDYTPGGIARNFLKKQTSQLAQKFVLRFVREGVKQVGKFLFTTPTGWIVLAIILVFIILIGITFTVMMDDNSNDNTAQSVNPGRTAGGTNPGGSSSISNTCNFFRGDLPQPGAPYQSPELLKIFQEAADKSGVPAAVLAGIARVESPSIVTYSDSTLSTFACPRSPTGALGLMQIQPKGTLGHDATAVAKGASYLGIDYNSLTEADYCDIRKSIFLAAGVINQKRVYNTGREWDATKTNDQAYISSVASTYYGCTNYPSCSSGPYSYADDLWNSVSNCKGTVITGPPSSTGTVCPIPSGKVSCGPSKPTSTRYPACSIGHCAGPEYCPGGTCPSWCTSYPATAYAADIPAQPNQDVLMPEITVPGESTPHTITCTYVGSSPGTANPSQITAMFACKDDMNGKKVWIQFSHTLNGSQPNVTGAVRRSGDVIGKADPDNQPGVGTGFPHTHVQIGINGECTGNDFSGCVGADQYLQCK